MRIEREVVSISWIPSEAISGIVAKGPFEVGIAHYDEPLPDHIDDLVALRDADRFRFANQLRAWVDVEDGKIVGADYSGGAMLGSTTIRAGRAKTTFEAYAMPTLQDDPVVEHDKVTFVQTVGGGTGVPAPRRVNHAPFVQWRAPLVWSTLALTINADGTASYEVRSTTPFPRHWIYGFDGNLEAKSGMTDFKDWYRHAFGKHSPWGDESSPALITAAESALERQLSTEIMRGGEKPELRKVKKGTTIVSEGDEGRELFLILDGVVRVDVNDEPVAEMGPGAIFGERALLEGGFRTSTLVAVTACRLAVARGDQLDPDKLKEVAAGHRREEPKPE